MAFLESKNIKIEGIAGCVPKRIVENSSYQFLSKDEIEKYIAATGIVRRHCAINDGTICCSDLCYTAADALLNELDWNRNEIDLLVFVSQTPDFKLPATACILQNRLGLSTSCMSFDVSYGCSGYVYGLSIVSSMLSSNGLKKALLLVGNTQSFFASPKDKSLAMLFGDGGTATAISYNQDSGSNIVFNLCSDGSGSDVLKVLDGGFRNPVSHESFVMVDYGNGISRTRLHESMDGAEVFSFALKRAPQVCIDLLEHFSIEQSSIDYFCIHQANKFICEKIRKKLHFEQEQVPYNLHEYGNTSGASIPLLIVTELASQLKQSKKSLLCVGFGVGLSWGAVHLTLDNIKVPDLLYL